jgi:hypothetical protein
MSQTSLACFLAVFRENVIASQYSHAPPPKYSTSAKPTVASRENLRTPYLPNPLPHIKLNLRFGARSHHPWHVNARGCPASPVPFSIAFLQQTSHRKKVSHRLSVLLDTPYCPPLRSPFTGFKSRAAPFASEPYIHPPSTSLSQIHSELYFISFAHRLPRFARTTRSFKCDRGVTRRV